MARFERKFYRHVTCVCWGAQASPPQPLWHQSLVTVWDILMCVQPIK